LPLENSRLPTGSFFWSKPLNIKRFSTFLASVVLPQILNKRADFFASLPLRALLSGLASPYEVLTTNPGLVLFGKKLFQKQKREKNTI
jgi:hypothetical protein